MKRAFWGLGVAAALAGSAGAFASPVTLEVNQWQGTMPYQWVRQTHTSKYFSTGVEYAGLVGGTVGNGSHYVWLCDELNQNVMLGEAYQYTQYKPTDFESAPLQTGRPVGAGTALTSEQKALVEGIFRTLGVGEANAFTSPYAQDLIGVSMANSADLGTKVTKDEAAAAQLLIWEVTHEAFDPAHPLAGANLTDGYLRWANNDGSPLPKSVVDAFDGLKNEVGSAAVPEPGAIALGLAGLGMMLGRRRRARQR
jgi:hypothetical protein